MPTVTALTNDDEMDSSDAFRTPFVRAPFATLGSRRSTRPPVAVVFAAIDDTRDELLLVIDPELGRCQGEYYSREFDGEGAGEVTLKRLTDHAHVVIGQLEVRGFNTRTERCEVFRVDAAVNWSVDPVTGQVDVAGTALVLRPGQADIGRMEAVTGHSFNRFDSLADVSFDDRSTLLEDASAA
jgi:hypothetical protein